jgi:ArsR family transcriptional regulator
VETISERLEQEVHLLHSHICEGLADPKRVLILYLLSYGSRNVTELAEALGAPQPTVSHHLKVLRDRGLVETERDGTAIYYSLADRRTIEALDIMRTIVTDIVSQRASVVLGNQSNC